jgi:hypothetical protein
MDKKLLKSYIRTIVEEEVERLLPKMLSEAVEQIKTAKSTSTLVSETKKPAVDKKRLAELIGLDYDRTSGTLSAFADGMHTHDVAAQVPANVDPEVSKALTRDYSQLMKAMKLT